MNKKITIYVLSGAMLLGVAGASAIVGGPSPKEAIPVTTEYGDNVVAFNPSVRYEKVWENGSCYLKFTVTTPRYAMDMDTYDYLEPETFSKLIFSIEGAATPLEIKENVAANETFEFVYCDDSNLAKEISFIFRAYVGETEGEASRARIYYGEQPLTPAPVTLSLSEDSSEVSIQPEIYTDLLSEETMWDDDLYQLVNKHLPDFITSMDAEAWSIDPTGLEFTDASGMKTQGAIAEWSNIEPGAEVPAMVWTDFEQGLNTVYYRTKIYSGVDKQHTIGYSKPSVATIWIGEDAPKAPGNLQVQVTEQGNVLTWEAPTEGIHGAPVNTENLVYEVSRLTGVDKENKVILSKKVKSCTFTDDLSDLRQPTYISYRVKATNNINAGSTEENQVDWEGQLICGPAYKLPFKETFNSANPAHDTFSTDMLWTKDYSYSAYFDFGAMGSIMWMDDNYNFFEISEGVDGIDANGNNDGFFGVYGNYYSQYLQPGYLSSMPISVGESRHPFVSFYLAPVDGCSGNVTLEASNGELNADNEEEWIPLDTFSFDNDGNDEVTWIKKAASLADISDNNLRVRFKFDYTSLQNRHPMCIDQIEVRDYPGIENLSFEVEGNDLRLFWDCMAEEENVPTFEIYLDGELIDTVTNNEYLFAEADTDKTYIFTVVANYGDGIEISEEITASATFTGSIFESGNVISIEYFTPTGIRISIPEPGELVVARVKYADGTVKTVKQITK